MRIFISGLIEGPMEKVRERYRKIEKQLTLQDNSIYTPFYINENSVLSLPFRIQLLNDCDALFLLSDWLKSDESHLEKLYAETRGKKVLFQTQLSAEEENELRIRKIIENISSAINEVTGISFSQYVGGNRKSKNFFLKMLFTVNAINAGLEVDDIAAILMRDPTTINYYQKSFPRETKFNPAFRNMSEKVSEILNR